MKRLTNLLAVTALLAGCGGDGEDTTGVPTTTTVGGTSGPTDTGGEATSTGDGDTGDGDGCAVGELNCECYPNQTCNPGMVCQSGTCVGDGDGDGTTGDGTTGDGDGTTGDGTTGDGDGTTGDGTTGDGTTGDGDGDGTTGDGTTGDGTTGDGDGTTGDGDGTTGDGDGTTSGDGDGTTSGDGDGTTSGDGDGDGTTSGDGDGTTSGDGDGDGTTSGDGDGDGTTSGDGDGDGTTSGDGDGDGTTSGDGDGDGTGDGDGDGDGSCPAPGGTAPNCGDTIPAVGETCLGPAANFDLPSADPNAVRTGDLNTDGNIDIFASDINDQTVRVWLGDGNGGFSKIQTEHMLAGRGRFTRASVVGNFNGDSFPDYVSLGNAPTNAFTSSTTYRRFYVYLGNGNGGFDPLASAPTGTQIAYAPTAIAAGDYDGVDASPDIVIASSNTAHIFTGTSPGNFQAGIDFDLSPGTNPSITPNYILFEDVNGDGRDDLVAVGGTQVVVALREDETAIPPPLAPFTISHQATIPTAAQIRAVRAADIAGSNAKDLLIAIDDNLAPRIVYLEGVGDGTFSAYNPQREWPISTDVWDLWLVDLNEDTHLDSVTVHELSTADLNIRLGDGSGSDTMFGTALAGSQDIINLPSVAGAYSMAIADIDGDMNLDAVIPGYATSAGGSSPRRAIYYAFGDGSGTLAEDPLRVSAENYTNFAGSVSIGDFNLDTFPDVLVTPGQSSTSSTYYADNYNWTTALINDSFGTLWPGEMTYYSPSSASVSSEAYPWGLDVTDVDRDGDDDVVYTRNNGDAVTVVISNGVGGLKPPTSIPISTGVDPEQVEFVELNDGPVSYPDILTKNRNGAFFSGVQNQLGGNFATTDIEFANTNADPTPAIDMVTVDADNDGRLDVITLHDNGAATSDSEFFSVYTRDQNFSFNLQIDDITNDGAPGANPAAIAAGYFDSDNNADLVIAHQGLNQIDIWLGNGDGTFGDALLGGTPITANPSPRVLEVADMNNDGFDDIVIGLGTSSTANVLIYFGDNSGSFNATSSVALDSPGTPLSFEIEDLNGDCAPDLLVGNTNDEVSVFLSNP